MDMEEETARLLVQTALPIDAIDQIIGVIPGRTATLVWVDLQDRPDLLHMNQRHASGSGDFVATWFFVESGKRQMLVGLRVEVRAPFTATFSLVFPMKRYFPQLESIAEDGLIWVEPGPPPDTPARIQAMSVEELLAVVGDGISLDLEEPQRQQLREQLAAWKQREGNV
jgi:hypothetical protein